MGGKNRIDTKYGDPEIRVAREDFSNYQHPIIEQLGGYEHVCNPTIIALVQQKNTGTEELLPMDCPVNDDGTINVYALFDVDTGQVRADLFHTIREFQIGEKTYTFIDVDSLEKNSYFLVDLDNKVSFPGLQKGFAWRLESVAVFGDNEILIGEISGGDTTFCRDNTGKKLVEKASSVSIIPCGLGTIDLLKVRKHDFHRDYDMTFYLGSDGNKYQKNSSGVYVIIG